MKKQKTWYSNGLTENEARKLERTIVRIANPEYGINQPLNTTQTLTNYGPPYLECELITNKDDCAFTLESNFQLTKEKDIVALLSDTHAYSISALEGKTAIAYLEHGSIRSISINGYLNLKDLYS